MMPLKEPLKLWKTSKNEAFRYIRYLGKALPAAIFSMPVVYCLKEVSILSGSHGLPELISVTIVAGLH